MLKAEIINQAYAQIRISGLTTQEVPEEITIALLELDQMMAVWLAIGRDVNYNFPPPTIDNAMVLSDPSEDSDLMPWAAQGVVACLAKGLVEYFNKEVPQSLMAKARFGLNVIKQQTVKLDPQCYPSRMPVGSGNRFRDTGMLRRFHTPYYAGRVNRTPIQTHQNMDLTCDFSNMLAEGDAVESYTITAAPNGGIVVDSHTRNENVVSYRVTADRDRDGSVEIVATTTNGLTLPKTACFDTQESGCVVRYA